MHQCSESCGEVSLYSMPLSLMLQKFAFICTCTCKLLNFALCTCSCHLIRGFYLCKALCLWFNVSVVADPIKVCLSMWPTAVIQWPVDSRQLIISVMAALSAITSPLLTGVVEQGGFSSPILLRLWAQFIRGT